MTNQKCITSLLEVLDQQLQTANHVVRCAYEAAITGNQNLAIGTLLPAERNCEDAAALLRVILSLHRHGRDAKKGGAQ